MTRDRRAKQHARREAAESGRRYTAARREGDHNPRGFRSTSRPSPASLARQDEPTFDERCYRLPWADVVLDGRKATDFWYPLPTDTSRLPPTGDRSGANGVLRVGRGAETQVTVSAHMLNLPATSPAVPVRVHYPDGFRLATVGSPLGTYRTSLETAWKTYLSRQPDGFARAFAPAGMYPEVSDEARERAVRTGARVLRAAAADPHRWYAPRRPPDEEWPDGNAVTDLVQLASFGFRSHSDAEATIESLGDHDFPSLLDAQDAGFSLDENRLTGRYVSKRTGREDRGDLVFRECVKW